MSVLEKTLQEHREKILHSEAYRDICDKVKKLDPEIIGNTRMSRSYRDGALSVDYFGPIGDYTRDDLRTLGVRVYLEINQVIWVEEDFDIDGNFRGYEVQLGDNEEYFSKEEDLFDYISHFPGHKVLSYSSDCGEEAINIVENPRSWFSIN